MEGTRLVLIRHGESQAQVDAVVGGHRGCTGLSDLGRRQVEALGERLRSTDELGEVAAVYASVMPRAVETAEMLASAVGRVDVVEDCLFCEHHPGEEGDGLPWEEFERRFPVPDGETWDPDFRREPDGETWGEMALRVGRGLDTLIERHPGETVLIASHGGVIVHSMLRWLDLTPAPTNGARAWFHPENTSITEWCWGPIPFRDGATGWQLVRFNDHAHLSRLLVS